jgi:nucleoside-diphosphate-sugar epimerase
MSPLTGAVNIGSGEAVSLRHVGEMLARLAGRPDLLRVGALTDRISEPERLVMDVARLSEATDFCARIPLEKGLADALTHWQAELRR